MLQTQPSSRATYSSVQGKEKVKVRMKTFIINIMVLGLEYDFFYHFMSADSLPSSDNWLKEKKWTWRNEQDWKIICEG